MVGGLFGGFGVDDGSAGCREESDVDGGSVGSRVVFGVVELDGDVPVEVINLWLVICLWYFVFWVFFFESEYRLSS